ncbi:FtsX-like permease family protein [Jatrophihabitans sp.]|uniref:FtsX-like permease family protein n=1 Tax=Jatrophihabitans sp. TaxID=1932789 RepID=UPI002EE71E93
MIHLLLVRLRVNRWRATALIVGIAAATTAFVVLTGQVAEQRLELRGRVSARGNPNYDILVRPAGSRTGLETSQGLVRANFLSGQFGGITLAQWHQIEDLAGVQVAAPVAMVGYVLQSVTIPIDITDQLSSADQQLFTASVRRRSARGLSEFSQPAISYSFVSATAVSQVGKLGSPGGPGFAVAQRDGSMRLVCPIRPRATGSPFAVRSQRNGTCWSRVNGPDGAGFTTLPRGHVGILVQWTFPFLLAAVDPGEEAELAGLDRAVSHGSYLPQRGSAPGRDRHSVPVLMADHAGFDDQDEVSVQRLSAAATAEFGSGLTPDRLDALLDTEHGPVVTRASITAEAAYQHLLTESLRTHSDPVVDSYWTSGLVSYDTEPDGTLRPRPVDNPASIWTAPLDERGYVAAAPDAADTAFRRLDKHELLTMSTFSDGAGPRLATIGTFDESRLDQGSGQSLPGGYRTEPLLPADPASTALLRGQPLLPDLNIAGYLLPAPTMLTSLDAASVFTDSSVFDNVSDAAPISAVKVRVAGVHGTDAVSRERVRLVAEAVAATTGLDVDVTVGSSPITRRVVLPAGSAGRPELQLAERWQRKGVIVAVVRVVDRKSLLLFVLVLVVCGVFIANATAAAARSPRTELSTLSCLGWTRGQLMRLLLGEMAVIGAAAGVAGALVSLIAAEALRVPVSVGRALAAVPAALAVTLLAAAWPAWRASLPSPSPDMSDRLGWARPIRGGQLKRVRGPLQLAYLNLRAEPGRTALGTAAVGVGSAGLTLLLAITVAFRGSVVGSLLGDVVSLQARRVDYLAVVSTLLLAAIAVADVSYLNIRERRDDLALLRAVGWTDRWLGQLITFEGVLIGLAGSVAGSGLGLVAAAALAHSVPGSLWLLAGLTALTGTLISALATLLAALSLPVLLRTPSLTRD